MLVGVNCDNDGDRRETLQKQTTITVAKRRTRVLQNAVKMIVRVVTSEWRGYKDRQTDGRRTNERAK